MAIGEERERYIYPQLPTIIAPKGSGEMELVSLWSGEMVTAPKGSGETEPMSLGLGETVIAPKGLG